MVKNIIFLLTIVMSYFSCKSSNKSINEEKKFGINVTDTSLYGKWINISKKVKGYCGGLNRYEAIEIRRNDRIHVTDSAGNMYKEDIWSIKDTLEQYNSFAKGGIGHLGVTYVYRINNDSLLIIDEFVLADKGIDRLEEYETCVFYRKVND